MLGSPRPQGLVILCFLFNEKHAWHDLEKKVALVALGLAATVVVL
jgi:hypothetical protein